jgi:hypothetical protein
MITALLKDSQTNKQTQRRPLIFRREEAVLDYSQVSIVRVAVV